MTEQTKEEFRVGDVVELKSTEWLKMTVEATAPGLVHCVWFGNMNQLCRDTFSTEVLRHNTSQKAN